MTLDEMRADFIVRRRGSVSLPTAGAISYATAALLSLAAPQSWHNAVLAACFFAVMPIGALVGRVRGEQMTGGGDNPLFRLSALMRIMVLATWSVHVPIWIYAPALFPLSVGICFALHWVVFTWIVDHPVGLAQLGMRVVAVPAAWLTFPQNRMGAVAAAVSLCYAISAFQLSRIRWDRRLADDHIAQHA